MENFNEAAGEIAESAVQYARERGAVLDYTKESLQTVDCFLGDCHDGSDRYDDEEGAKLLWNAAVLFGTYIGETLLRQGLAEKGFVWVEDDGLPVLNIPGGQTTVSPISKAHKRIQNGEEDSITSFADVVFSIADGEWPKTGVLRVPDAETAGGKKVERIVLKETDYYISLVADGMEDFVIFNSHDGFFQFYGVGDQFVCEAWFNLGETRAYAMINPVCTNTGRVELVTPFGRYTPKELEIISKEQLKTAVHAYFSSLEEADFLAKVPHEKLDM